MWQALVIVVMLLACGIGAVALIVCAERASRAAQRRGRVRVETLIDANRAKPRPGMDRRDDQLLAEMATRGRRYQLELVRRHSDRAE